VPESLEKEEDEVSFNFLLHILIVFFQEEAKPRKSKQFRERVVEEDDETSESGVDSGKES
jgi:hypothetical protein